MDKAILLEINDNGSHFEYLSNITTALRQAENQLLTVNDTIDSVAKLRPACDKIDYTLAASSGALCGVIDIFLVRKPGDSPLGDITDQWFQNRTCIFAKFCGWKGSDNDSVHSAIRYLETHFKVPYDQRGCGDAGAMVFDLNPSNHHFKSLAHHPSLLGLFFSVLDQFSNSSHFISNGNLIELVDADNQFKLRGNNFIAKLWCGIVNWFCHILSDASGSSGSLGRGTGIPSPLMSWTNSIIAIKNKLGISVNQFDKDANQLALDLFKNGFDLRFQITQAIPVFINELLVRFSYCLRRMIRYYQKTPVCNRTYQEMWLECKPYGNPTVKRMLTVAHGTFCLIDASDAVVRSFIAGGGNFNPLEFFLRLNIIGVGRFTISLYGEMTREINYCHAKKEADFAKRRKTIIEDYIAGLHILEELYDDSEYLSFIEDICKKDFITAFNKTAALAALRNVPDDKILKNKSDIDNYFKKMK